MGNFVDEETGKEFLISNHRVVFRENKWVNVFKHNGKIITNPDNGNILTYKPKEGTPNLLKSNNKEERVKMLKKRSKDHYQREISEKKYEMNKELVNKFKNEK